jgi:hypothetical protein
VVARFTPAHLDLVAKAMTTSFALATATAAVFAAVVPGGRRLLPAAAFAVLLLLGARLSRAAAA